MQTATMEQTERVDHALRIDLAGLAMLGLLDEDGVVEARYESVIHNLYDHFGQCAYQHEPNPHGYARALYFFGALVMDLRIRSETATDAAERDAWADAQAGAHEAFEALLG
jgi:hypothetical protein